MPFLDFFFSIPTYFLFILIGLVPGLFWMWFFYRKDREKPEPLRMLLLVFIWGMIATVPAIFLELAASFAIPLSLDGSDNVYLIILGTFFIIAPIEEYFKYLVVKRIAYNNKNFDQPLDGIIYAVTAALGFASLENILVVFSFGGEAIILRFITATLIHAIASGIVGYHLGLAKFYHPDKLKSLVRQGLFTAIVLHGLYNFVATTDTVLTIPLLVVLIVVGYLLLAGGIRDLKRKERASLLEQSQPLQPPPNPPRSPNPPINPNP